MSAARCETRLSSVLTGGRVEVGFRAGSLDDAVARLLGPLLRQEGLTEPATVSALDAVLSRERSGATTAGSVALPHARLAGLSRIVAALAINADGVYSHSPCATKALLVFASPAQATVEHLKFLGGVAQLFRSDETVERLLAAETSAAALDVIRGRER
jgi:mannitol/fructose-specific phosphotransferase system IIA component (Ntr-type)